VCAWINLPKSMWKQANFYMDFALHWLDTVDTILACLNYVTLVTLLRYFDHLNSNPCVWMGSYTKIHMEIGKFTQHFHMDFTLYWLDTENLLLARLNYVSLVIFLWYFDHSNYYPCVWMDSCTEFNMEIGEFPHGLCIILACSLVLDCNTIQTTKFLYLQLYCKIFWVVK
jgi:hypothetical protein